MPSVNVSFWQLEKRTNSTMIPSGNGTRYACQIFDTCSMVTPRIRLNINGAAGNPTLLNYCYIDDLTRYYFVKDWVWLNGLWEAQLVEDVCATWRNNILNATEYVSRAASDFDGRVVDTLYPTISNVEYAKVTATNPYNDNVETGNFILSTVCSGYAGFGATTYWRLSAQAFESLRTAMLSSADYLNISSSEISGDLTKALFNPYQYCVSCMWFPLTMPLGEAVTQLAFGWWTVPVEDSASVVTAGLDTMYIYRAFAVPKHPQSAERGSFLNISPYSRYTLYFPPFGEIALDGNKIGDAATIYAKVLIDAYTGAGYLYVSTDDPGDNLDGMASNIIAVSSAQIGVPVSLAQLSYETADSVGQLVSTAITGLYGAAKGLVDSAGHITSAIGSALSGDFSGAVDELGEIGGTVANNVGDAAQASLTEVQYKGTCGAVSVYNTSPYLQARFFRLVDDDPERRGRPLCKVRRLGDLSGYVKCLDSDIAIAGTKAEAEAVKQYLATGIFIE